MQDVIEFRNRLVDEYATISRSFSSIPVLKANELRQLGEYRTRPLVPQAWDRWNTGESAPC